ncbi:type IV pilin protein [Comamonas nitrativorans]|uniref:Type IV pilin protein n=1 Tax=Comamonas nitrativorans TaxID=108437 RepID=A0ABV9GW18_9BURK
MHTQRHIPTRPSQKGFTLIEVMIVVAIVGILSSIAYPSYTEYVRKGHRASAKAALLQAAQWMERAATATGAYPATTSFPDNLKTVEGDRYTVSINTANDRSSYTLTATPKGAQSGDKCGNFTLTNTGAKDVSVSGKKAECWGQ